MKVAISAYSCTPGAGSEPGAGWTWARAAATGGHEVWLFTRANNREGVEAALTNESDLTIHPVYVDVPWAMKLKKGPRFAHPYYFIWQGAARREIAAIHRYEQFDVAHHLTFATDWMPAAATGVSGLPSVWGPVGGVGTVPAPLWRWLGVAGVVTEALREVPVRALRWVYGRRNATRAEIVIAQNTDVGRHFCRYANDIRIEPNVAFNFAEHTEVALADSSEHSATTRAVFVGRLIGLKGPRLALETLCELDEHWSLDVYGEGPLARPLRAFARRRGLADRVLFHGRRPRNEVLAAIATADVMLHPSMHEAAGWVVGEAMSLGTPVVALDIAGPATMLRECGYPPVPAGRNLAKRLAAAMERALQQPRQPTDRWSAARLSSLLDGIYRDALASSKA